MNVGELVIGLAVLAAAAFLVYLFRQQRSKLALMAATPTFTTAELEEARQKPILASGSVFPFLAEVNGIVECERPLTAQLSGEQCVAFRSLVQREWEERKEVRANDGSVRTEMVSHTDTVSENRRETKFLVRDEGGAIELAPDGADLDMTQVFDRFEPFDEGAMQVQFGSFSFSVGTGMGVTGARTRGYRAKEWALLPGTRIYVLAEVQEQGSKLVLAKPTAPDGLFIVSTKTERELKSSANTEQWLALAGAIALLAAGIGLLIHSLLGGA